jgi:pteridine reductase
MVKFPLAIVTGGAHRLGRSFVLALAERGYGVLVHYHQSSQQAVDTVELVNKFNVPAFSYQADLCDPFQVNALFSFVDELLTSPESELSHLSVLVNSASHFSSVEALKMSVEEWDTTLELNLRGPFLCAQQAAYRMPKGGLIINVTDIGAQRNWSRFPAYTVSKAGLESLTRVLARALAPAIRVNAIAPGLVLPAGSIPSPEWRKLVKKLPLRRSTTTDEVAFALEYLIKNGSVTGQTMVVDGGYSLI